MSLKNGSGQVLRLLGMGFDFPGEDVEKSKDWRQRVQLHLAQEGFPEVATAWKSRFWKGLHT